MKIEDIVAISGLPGLYKIVTSRANGMIVEEIPSGKSRFASVRKHQFTPLGTVAIYTEDDAVEIKKVFEKISSQEAENPIPALSSSQKELFGYFATIVPEYSRDQVMISDVKKVIKWYKFLVKNGLFPFSEEESSGEEE